MTSAVPWKTRARSTCVLLVLLFSSVPLISQNRPQHATIDGGIRFGVLTTPAGPYSYPNAVGPYVDMRLPALRDVTIGMSVLLYSFAAREAPFSDSVMIVPGVSLGYTIATGGDPTSRWFLQPYLEQRHYFWSQSISGETRTAYRPMTAAGMGFFQTRGSRIRTGFGVEYVISWEDEPVHLLGVLLNLGLCLSGASWCTSGNGEQ